MDTLNQIPENHISKEHSANEERGRIYWLFRNIYNRTIGRFIQWAKANKLRFTIITVILLITLFCLRSWYHPLLLNLRKYFLLILLISFISWAAIKYIKSKKFLGEIIGFSVLISFWVLAYFFGPATYRYIGLYIHYQSIEKVKLEKFPYTIQERIHPLNSIKTLVNQEVMSETEEATLPHIIIRKNGRLDFSMGIGPSTDYLYQQLTDDMYQVLSIPANEPNPDFSSNNRHDVNFDIGENLVLSKNTWNDAIKCLGPLQYFSYEPDEVKFIENEKGEWIQVVTLIKWTGWLIPRPVFGGVIEIRQLNEGIATNFLKRLTLGRGEYFSPEEISKIEYLKNQNLISDKIGQFTAESFRFQNGFWAPMPGYHKGDIRIPVMPSDQNQQPFVTYFNFAGEQMKNEILCHYFGLEPYQESKRALNTSLFIPSNGIENKVYFINHTDNQDAYTGSSAVSSKVKESKKNYDWSINKVAETRPFVRDINGQRTLFWLSTVVTKIDENSGDFIGGTTPEVTLTNARTGEVYWVNKSDLKNDNLWVEMLKN